MQGCFFRIITKTIAPTLCFFYKKTVDKKTQKDYTSIEMLSV